MWGAADYARLAVRFAEIHDQLVARLEPRRGVRWLDVATGTGEVALRAARGGADVTGVDISERLLEQASAAAQAESLSISFQLGDAQKLPFGDASFDVVTSVFGVIFAPDQEAVASELARVCRPGGRLGLATWGPKPELRKLYDRFQEEPPAHDVEAWGHADRLEQLLGGQFELEVVDGVWHLEGESPEAVWEFMLTAAPPAKAFFENLDQARRQEFRHAFIEH